MCGIPGCGKTALCKAFCENVKKSGKYDVTHLVFDGVLHAKISASGGVFDPEMWHVSRKEFLSSVEKELNRMNEEKKDCVRSVVLLDDNFPLSSMRLAVARIAQRFKCAFAVVVVTQSLDVALERNKQRIGAARVDDAVLLRMNQSIEFPWDGRHYWERNWIHIDGSIITDISEQAQKMFEWIESLSLEPVVLIDPTKVQIQHQEDQSDASVKHQFDLWMRKVVSMIMESTEPSQRATAAKSVAAAKKAAPKPTKEDDIFAVKQQFVSLLSKKGFIIDESIINIQ